MNDKEKFREEVIKTIACCQKMMEENVEEETKAALRFLIADLYDMLRKTDD